MMYVQSKPGGETGKFRKTKGEKRRRCFFCRKLIELDEERHEVLIDSQTEVCCKECFGFSYEEKRGERDEKWAQALEDGFDLMDMSEGEKDGR